MAYTERQLLQERQATVLLSTELSNMFNRAMKSVTQELEREYEQERKKAKREREKMYSARKAFVRACLERYRASPEGTPIRTMIDSLIIANRDCSDFSERNRIQHNAIVLRYIIGIELPDIDICRRLHIRIDSLERYIERAIGDLTILFYGINGIDPDWIGGTYV